MRKQIKEDKTNININKIKKSNGSYIIINNLAYEKQTYIENYLHYYTTKSETQHNRIDILKTRRVMSHTYDFQWQRQSEEKSE